MAETCKEISRGAELELRGKRALASQGTGGASMPSNREELVSGFEQLEWGKVSVRPG